ncbi:hypothetical protein C5167_000099 [Papaver somniferum]|uniref:Uncharacterized protein n=1 Tax=Papaver somniferum TaxID=3469 RepID=A0A4Y7KU67_PAPSO|nr:hypothetical protein C5167_000099 [Papaver somniferum]
MDPKTSSSSSFEISYLMNSCGLSEKEALTASTKLKFKTSTKPDAVLAIYNQALNGHVMEEGMQGSAMKKEQEDKPIEEDEIDHVPGVEKVVEDSQKVASNKVEESKKTNKPKKILKKSKTKLEQVQDTAAIKCVVEVPELLQASNRPVTEDFQNKEATFCPESATESIAALPKESNVLTKVKLLEEAEDLKKAKTPKKIFIKPENFFEEAQGSVAQKEEEEKSEEEEDIVAVPMVEKILEESDASMLKSKLVLATAEEPKKAESPKKLLRKSKKKSKEEDEVVAVSMLEKVLDNSQASMLKSKVSLDEVEESKKAVKKVLKKPKKKKAKEIQGAAAIKYDVEVPDLLQASNRPVMEDSQDEEGTFCPESVTESIAALPKVANVVDQSKVGEPKKKASSSDLVEQEKKLEDEEESMKTKTSKKIMIKSKKNVEVVQDSAAKKEDEKMSKEEEYIVAVPIIEEILEDSQASMPKRKLVFDTMEEPKKAKRPKKLLKKSKKKVVEEQCSGAKKEEHDMSKEEDEVAAVSVVVKVLENSDASMLKSKVSLDEVEESKKAKKFKKVLKKPKKKAEQMQGSAAIKYDVQVPELLQSKKKVVEEQCSGAKKEEHDFSKEEDEVAAVSVVEKVLENSVASVLESKVSLDEVEESKKAKKIKKVLRKPKKKPEEMQGSAAINYDVQVPELLQVSNRPVTEDSQNKEVAFCSESVTESIAALPEVANVVDQSEPVKKASSSDLVSNRPVVEDSQNEEVIFCHERVTESRAALPEVANVVNQSEVGAPKEKALSGDLVEQEKKLEEESKKAKTPKKLLKKSKKNVEVVQDSAAKKEEHDKSKEEDEVAAVSVVEKVLENSQASMLKRKVSLDEVEESKKAKKIKKVLIKPKKKKAKEMQGTAMIKYDVEVPELFQCSSFAKGGKSRYNSEVGGLKKKASSRDLVHQNEKLEQEEEELKKAKKPKEDLEKKEEEDKPVERKLFLDSAEEPKKAQRPKKALKSLDAINMNQEALYGDIVNGSNSRN